MSHRPVLAVLYETIEVRVQTVHAESDASGADWPCRRSCDTCCHRLSEVPQITHAEWSELERAIDRVPEHHALFNARMGELQARMHDASSSAVVCPFLAPSDGVARPGSCTVYEGRPAACRTYGYYAERSDVLGCSDVLARSEGPAVTWGNQASVLRILDALCTDAEPRRSILAWWSERV